MYNRFGRKIIIIHSFKRLGKEHLEKDKFIHYMKQDYVYLIDYSKLFSVGVTKAQNLETMQKFTQTLHETLHFEMELHRHLRRNLALQVKS